MHTVGELLKTARISKELSLEEVEKRTKIRVKFLFALEENDFASLPSEAYTRGFVKNYSQFLRLDTTKMLALLRRQLRVSLHQKVIPTVDSNLTETKFQMTPSRALGFIVAFLGIVAGVYLFWQYRLLHEPPKIVWEEPKDGAEVDKETVSVFGYTDPDATISINTTLITTNNGKFFQDIKIAPGDNTIVIVATNRFGATTTIERKIHLKPGEN